MKKVILTSVDESMIEKHEDQFAEEIRKIMQQYKGKFADLGLQLHYRIFWENTIHNKIFDSRIPLENGYRSYIIIEAQRNNKKVLLNDDENGQIFVISSIVSIDKQLFTKCYVTFSEEIDDIIEDLEESYHQVKEYGVIEWENNLCTK